MPGIFQYLDAMLQNTADALGPDLLRQVAFVGGCTTGLILTDSVSKEAVRFTDDVDLIVHVMGRAGWYAMRDVLRSKGFSESPLDNVNCRMRLKRTGREDLIVDFMPDDAAILGYTNRWYADALQAAVDTRLMSGTIIRVVTPVHFVATKLEAYYGRGNNDLLASRDMEDLLSVIDGRASLAEEIASAAPNLKNCIAQQFTRLMAHRDFEPLLQTTVRNNYGREDILFQRWETIANLTAD